MIRVAAIAAGLFVVNAAAPPVGAHYSQTLAYFGAMAGVCGLDLIRRLGAR
jgi:hypothetical protein